MPKKIFKDPEGYVTIKIPSDLAIVADKLIGKYGFKSRGEIVKTALRDLVAEYPEATAAELPNFEHFNMGDTGIKILDRKLHRIADITFAPKGIYCELDQTDECEHIAFALTISEVQGIIRKKRKEGWKLPEA